MRELSAVCLDKTVTLDGPATPGRAVTRPTGARKFSVVRGVPDQPGTAERPSPDVPTPAGTAAPVRGGDSARVRATADGLLARMARLPEGHPERPGLRKRVIEAHLPFAAQLARRFGNRGEPMTDLIQVATIGLIKAVDRYDITRGIEFARFAAPTIIGEVKRHFRDKGWAIRVPRELQELRIKVTKARSELAVAMGRSPSAAEIATHLDTTERKVLDAIHSGSAYRPGSLHVPVPGDHSGVEMRDVIGGPDPELESAENRVSLRPLIRRLPDRERRIVALRFFADMTQAQIAAEVGISQMHVSRLLSRSLRRLRAGLAEAG